MEQTWDGIINIGLEVKDLTNIDSWRTPGGLVYRDGYCCKRSFKIGNITYELRNRIYKSERGNPMFESVYEDKDGKPVRLISTNPTTVYRKVLEKFKVRIKGKLNGQRFFGLNTKDYEFALDSEFNNLTTDVQFDNSPGDFIPVHVRKSTFKRLVSTGTPFYGPGYTRKIANVSCRLQPGYEIIRQMQLPNSSMYVDVHLCIERGDNGPIFKGFTMSEPIINVANKEIATVVAEVFSELKINPSKNWSAVEFFGLDRSEVIEVTSKPPKIPNEPSEVLENVNDYSEISVLNDAYQIRRRNAGPTSNLCPKAIKARNEIIHKLVQYASFGDVASMYDSFFCYKLLSRFLHHSKWLSL